MLGRLWKRRHHKELDPDEIFLDSRNLPSFDRQQFEGSIEQPISKNSVYLTALILLILGAGLIGRIGFLQIAEGSVLSERSDRNKLRHTVIFPDRGIIYDRNGQELAWNSPDRVYTDQPGFAHLVGYVGFANAEEIIRGDYHPKTLIGKDGAERVYNHTLAGSSGIKIEEIDAVGNVFSDHVLREPESGSSIKLSVDAELQSAFYQIIAEVAESADYVGGAGVIMDTRTGELISLVSYPEFDPTIISQAEDGEAIRAYLTDPANPFLNRAIAGSYTPGSIVKPFVALAALAENIISPSKEIVSTGRLILPNPYDPDKPTIFRDWKAHGAVDMRRALAVSSDVYFYQIGGGFEEQKGLGISLIEKYARLFGFGSLTGIDLPGEVPGVIPNPKWKADNFDGEPWRVGNTYHTAIGQYGFLVNPLQAAQATAALASGGKLFTPKILALTDQSQIEFQTLELDQADLQVVTEGMRQAVTTGTATALNVPYVEAAAKSGTAEVGSRNQFINAWLIGFWPYEKPRYAFAVVMEQGRDGNLVGGGMVIRRLFDWINQNAPEYFEDN